MMGQRFTARFHTDVSEVSVASGATTDLSDALQLGGDGTRFLGCSVGEVLVYDVCLSGADLTNAVNYLTNKWI
jgi:hypothetical protein